MAGVGFNPQVVQGNLNRVRAHTVIPDNPQLSVISSNMGKSMAVLNFEGPFLDQLETGTGIVNSPHPYIMANIVISLLRSQSLAAAWIAQMQKDVTVGDVTIYADSTVFPTVILNDCSITAIDPGAFDGADPITKVTVRGTFNINADMWAGF